MSEGAEEIAIRLGTGFAAVVREFLPAVSEAVVRTGKDVSFGATVKIRREKTGLIVGKMIPHEPKIPTEPMDAIPFVLTMNEGGQLEFVYGGTIEELHEEQAEANQPDDGYVPGHNAGAAEE